MNKKLTLSLVSLAVAGALSPIAHATGDLSKVIITEYVEGSGYNKAIEISNLGDAPFRFDGEHAGVGLYQSSYGNLTNRADGLSVLTDVEIPANGSIVVFHGGADDALKAALNGAQSVEGTNIPYGTDGFYNNLGFSGYQGVWLGSGVKGATIHDFIGEHGSKSDKWGSDLTARRADNAKIPNSDPSKGLDVIVKIDDSKDDFSDLGTDNNSDSYLTPPPPKADITRCEGISEANPYDLVPGGKVTIEDIQGSGYQTPYITEIGKYQTDDLYAVEGIVSGIVNPDNTNFSEGFYLQQVSFDGADDVTKSNGLFVKTSKAETVTVGQKVCIIGNVGEDYGITAIYPIDNEWQTSSDSLVTVPATDLSRHVDDAKFRDTLERHEGMYINLPEDIDQTGIEAADGNQEMRVARTYAFNAASPELLRRSYRDSMTLSYMRPNLHPNQEYAPGSDESKAKNAENNDYTLYVELNEKDDTDYHATAAQNAKLFAAAGDKHIRINDSVSGMKGFLHYSYSQYRLLADASQPDVVYTTNTPIQENIYTDKGDVKKVVSMTPVKYDSDGKVMEDDAGDAIVDESKFAIKVATQNVLNYFNSPFGGAENKNGGNRGAESLEEFERQEAKIVKGIHALDADILGLMEIENNGFGEKSAISQLVAKVNEQYTESQRFNPEADDSAAKRYVFVGFDSDGNTVLDDEDKVGSDVITSGIIYRPYKVSMVSSQIINMPRQVAPPIVDENGSPILSSRDKTMRESGKNYMRDTVAARFRINGTGKSVTIAVNHLKSKGSTCWEDWQGWQEWEGFDASNHYASVKDDDFQGSCENFRVAGAQRLGEVMSRIKGDKMLIGDFNSYGHEDPMRVLTDLNGGNVKAAAYTLVGSVPQFGKNGSQISKSFGYINAVELKDKEKNKASWSYSYGDQVGSLDHMLISPSLKKNLLDAADWHVNSVESSSYGYNNKYTENEGNTTAHKYYEDNVYRSSDHDPAIVTLAYKYNEAGDEKLLLPIVNSLAKVSYVVPDGVELDKYTDIVAEITAPSHPSDAKELTLPKIKLDSKKVVHFDVAGIVKGGYTFSMKLRGVLVPEQGAAATQAEEELVLVDIPGSEVTLQAEVSSTDSLTASPTTPEYDGSGGGGGGSVGLLGMLSLFGFGFFRRRKSA